MSINICWSLDELIAGCTSDLFKYSGAFPRSAHPSVPPTLKKD
ncbi:MAG: hypothetical protein ACYC0D_03935 [Candidatus Humimicrobiaceae bacterium]